MSKEQFTKSQSLSLSHICVVKFYGALGSSRVFSIQKCALTLYCVSHESLWGCSCSDFLACQAFLQCGDTPLEVCVCVCVFVEIKAVWNAESVRTLGAYVGHVWLWLRPLCDLTTLLVCLIVCHHLLALPPSAFTVCVLVFISQWGITEVPTLYFLKI